MSALRCICVLLLAAADLTGAALLIPRLWNCGALAWIRAGGWEGALAFVALYCIATVVMVPPGVLNVAAGTMFGVLEGMLLVYPALIVGGMLSFWLSRSLARGWVAGRIAGHPKFVAIDRAMERGGVRMVLLLRMSPVSPFAFLSYSLGLTRVRLRDYFLGTLLGAWPGAAVYVYAGAAISQLSGGAVKQVVYWGGLAATVGAVVFITRLARQELRRVLEQTPKGTSPPDCVRIS